MIERDVGDAVPCFVNGGEVFGGFFDEREEDEAEELVGDAGVDDVFDLFDKVDEEEGCADEGEDEGDGAVGEFSIVF